MQVVWSRHRLRSDQKSNPIRWTWSGDMIPQSYFSWPSFRYYERIYDSARSTGRAKPVWHTAVKYQGDYFSTFPGDNGYTVYVDQGQLPCLVAEDFLARIPTIPESLGKQLGLAAFNEMNTVFPELISGSEFVLGFGKLKELLPKLEASITQTIAGGFLTKKFGWDNLLSDLSSLRSILQQVDARLQWLKQTFGKPTTVNFYRPSVLDHNPASWRSFDTYRAWATVIHHQNTKVDFRATATLVHEIGNLDSDIGRFRALAAAFGLDNPLKAIWVNMPMSFVVDWFIDVSGHLDRIAKIRPAEMWAISNLCHSWKIFSRYEVWQDSRPVYGSPTEGLLKRLGTVTVSDYVRLVGLPLGWSDFTLADLSPSSLALLLAMGGANSR